MKIGIDARLAFETGVGRYIRNLISELSKIDTKNTYTLFLTPQAKQNLWFTVPNSWNVHKTDIHWHSLKEQIQFSDILMKENFDLMHFPYFSLPIRYNRPFVVTIHDLIIYHFPTGKASTLPLPLYYVKRLAFDRVLRHGLEKSKHIIVPLNAVKEDILSSFSVPPEKISVTYEGVDASFFGKHQEKSAHAKPYFLYVGNAYPHKNVEGLLEGFNEYKDRFGGEMHLVLVGKEDYFYKKVENKYRHRKDIEFKHGISDGELAILYRGASAFISASLMEGFGLPPLEALAQGCVPLLSNIPSFREVCQDNALYFNPKNPSDIAQELQRVLNLSPEKKKAMLAHGKKRVEDFSWKEMAHQTLTVYERQLK